MTKQSKLAPEKSFVASKLPWFVAGAALLLYLVTMNRWVSLSNMASVARSAGWAWGPELNNPLYYLLTLPVRLLPEAWVPLAFNLFSVVCGAAALGLLARSVAILPRNRTHDQRQREKSPHSLLSIPLSWIPPVFAALACGLQLTFWEHSTSGSSDVFDLLLLAYIVRNLLEYRIDGRDSWLFKAALVCGAGMANNWLLFVLFPAFLTAVIWIKGLEFFHARFLTRMFFCGAAGMLLYLLLPTIHVLSDYQMVSFWQALKTNLTADKQAFMHFIGAGGGRKSALLLLALTSLVPLLIIGVRWPSNFGDPSRMGSAITSWVFHIAHTALLVLCVWVAFDPKFSPRRLGYSISALNYLGGISIGYLIGYFLLVFRPLPDRMGRTAPFQILLHRVSLGLTTLLVALVPVGLLALNLPQIRISNGPALREYAAQLVSSIPQNAIVLSDDSRKLYLAQAQLASSGTSKDHLFIDTQLITVPLYHAFQRERYGTNWPALVDTKRQDEVKAPALLNIVFKLAETRPPAYLHPSFGYYFEIFDQRARGLHMALARYPTNSINGAPLSAEEIAANENTWQQHQEALDRIIPFIAPPPLSSEVSFWQVLKDRLQIPFQPNATAVLLGSHYSQTLNFWAVQLQRAGELDKAQAHFRSALALFPDNIAARQNLTFNLELRGGRKPLLRSPKMLEEELGQYRNIQDMVRITGPFDEPTHCFALGLAFAQGNNFRQAAQNVERVYKVMPDNIQVAFWLSRLYVITQQADKATALLAMLRERKEELAEMGIRSIDLLQAEAGALYVAKRTEEADRLLLNTMNQDPKNLQTLATVVQIATVFRSYTNALLGIDRLLELKPDDVQTLISKGVLSIQAKKFADAIEPLTKVLSIQATNHGAQLYRAVAYLGSDRLDEAHQDYTSLLKTFPNSNDIHNGLADIALRRKDTNTAIHHLEICLRNLPIDSAQARTVSDRINELRNPPQQQ